MYVVFRLGSDSYANFYEFDSPLVQLFDLNIDGHDNKISTKQLRQQYFFVNFVACEYSCLSSLPSDLPFRAKLD